METCSICLLDIEDKNSTILDCKHKFHYDCIFKWNQDHNTCPVCRTEQNIDYVEENNTTRIKKIFNELKLDSLIPICEDCGKNIDICEDCNEHMCHCRFNHTYFKGGNPYSKDIMDTCLKCFENREENLLDKLLELNNEIYDDYNLFDINIIQDMYDKYYLNKTDREYQNYISFEKYEDFVEYSKQLMEEEMDDYSEDEYELILE